MNFLRSINSAKALCLAAATIAITLAGNIAPSQASQPGRVIQTPGQPEVVIFDIDLQSFAIGCQSVRNLWKGIPTERVSPQEYQKIISSASAHLVGSLACNAPNIVQGFTSPAFGSDTGVIVTGGVPFFVKTGDFFTAMGIKPTKLTLEQGNQFISQNRRINTNVTLETRGAAPIQSGSISFINRGGYVARYNLTYNLAGTIRNFDTGDIPIAQKKVFSIPAQATNIKASGILFTGLFTQTKPIFSRNISNPQSNVCFTTFGTTFNPQLNNSCN
jgi:hypothetical protein